ncbi:MAG: glycoside hydrolase family 3 protein [Candidatus Bipolaricaulota bacterium]
MGFSDRNYVCLLLVLILALTLAPANFRSAAAAGEKVESILSRLTLEEKIGQLLMVKVLGGANGRPDQRTQSLIQELNAGSVIFYSFPDPRSATEFTNRMQKWAKESSDELPLLVGSDMEYGPGSTVGGDATLFPHQMGIGATGDPNLAERAASVTAREGRSMGIHWNFAPVADTNTNPENPVIGVRSFGSDPETVGTFVKSAVRGYQEEGMIATLKHYPGHGDTSIDSHYGLPELSYDREELSRHLKPFGAGIAAGADAVMTAHIMVDSIDSNQPATTSKKIIEGLLREKQDFDGVVVTDALNMGAIEENFGQAEAAVDAIKAGADVLISAGNYSDALEIRDSLLEAVRAGEISVSSVDESVERVLLLKEKYGLLDGKIINDPAGAVEEARRKQDKAVVKELSRKAITLLRDNSNIISLSENSEVLLVGVKDSTYLLEEELKESLPGLDLSVYRTPGSSDYNDWSPSPSGIERAVELASEKDVVVLLTYSRSQLPEGQVELGRSLSRVNQNIVAVAEGLPYDYRKFPEVSTFIASYSYNRWNSPRRGHEAMTEAVVKVLTGEAKAKGEIP